VRAQAVRFGALHSSTLHRPAATSPRAALPGRAAGRRAPQCFVRSSSSLLRRPVFSRTPEDRRAGSRRSGPRRPSWRRRRRESSTKGRVSVFSRFDIFANTSPLPCRGFATSNDAPLADYRAHVATAQDTLVSTQSPVALFAVAKSSPELASRWGGRGWARPPCAAVGLGAATKFAANVDGWELAQSMVSGECLDGFSTRSKLS
jgi:hypothetical protein